MELKTKSSKYLLISQKDKYKNTNDKIISLSKDYYTYINSFLYEINYIEHIVNSYSPKKNFNIQNFLENQQSLIKELVHIINQILAKNQKSNFQSTLKKNITIKDMIKNHITKKNNFLRNITKENEDNTSTDINLTTNNNTNNTNINNEKSNKCKLNVDLSFLKVKPPYQKRKKINQYINKKEGNNINKSISFSTTNISSTKTKSNINISNSFISNIDMNKISNIANNNNSLSSLINGASSYTSNANLTKKNNIKRNITTKLITTTNYKNKRYSSTKRNTNNYYSTNNSDIQMNKSKPMQITDYSSNRVYIGTSNYNDSVSEDIYLNQEKYKKLCENKKFKINNLKKYEIVCHYQIKPNRMTKEMYNISFSILNKYEQKLKRNTSIGKRSKSSLL